MIPILWMIHFFSASLNVYTVHVKQEQNHCCIPRQKEALLGLTVFSCPHQEKEPTNLKLLSSREKKNSPISFTPEYLIMNLFKQKFQRSHCSNSLLPEVLSSPQQQNRRGGAEPQHFRQSLWKHVTACLVAWSYSFSLLQTRVICLNIVSGVFLLVFLKNVRLFKGMKTYKKQEQKQNASKKREEAVKCDQWHQIPFVCIACIRTENTDKGSIS